jgi:hypothetical protein
MVQDSLKKKPSRIRVDLSKKFADKMFNEPLDKSIVDCKHDGAIFNEEISLSICLIDGALCVPKGGSRTVLVKRCRKCGSIIGY